MKTSFIPLDYDSFDFEGRNYSLIIGRDDKGKKVCLIDSCENHLWAILKEKISESSIKKLIEKISKIELNEKGRKTRVEKVELKEKRFLGEKVKALKIYATNYKDLHSIADRLDFKEIKKRRGYDIGFATKYIIEKKLEPLKWYEVQGEMLNMSSEFGGIDNILKSDFVIKLNSFKESEIKDYLPKTLAYDIETDEIKIGEGEILMISLVGNDFQKVITWKKTPTKKKYVEFVKNEKELLKKFSEYINQISPDILVGYFSDGFDMPYIKSRADKFRVKLPLGIDGSQPKASGGVNQSTRIKGLVHVDLLKFIRTTYAQYMQSETLSLNDVAKEFLGDTKKNFKIEHSSKIDHKKMDDYFEYNLQDSILTYNLLEKFWPDMLEFSRVIKEPLYEVSRNGLSKQVESYILHNLEKYNEIPEKRPTREELTSRRVREKVEGAFVLEPKPGLYENVAMFDFTSMHTSIIISMNISKATFIGENPKDKKNSNSIKTRMGEFYFTKEPGFFPLMIKELFEKRRKFKAEYKKNPNKITKARSNAFKLLSASIHGYIGFFGARYFSLESSSAILAFVRKFNQDTIETIKKKGFNVIYGDTDSIAFEMNGKTKSQIKDLLKDLNNNLPGIMELELEGFFKRGIWVTTRSGTAGAKKKYAMISEDEELKIRGFETVRRDWCNLAREVQDKILRLILKEGNEKSALEYLKRIVKKIKNREVKLEELIIKTQLKKPLSEYKAISPHVVAAKKMREQEIPVTQGGLIEYYIAESESKSKLVRDKVKLLDEKGEYNIDYYLNKQILPAVENIFQIFKIDVSEIIEGKKQTTLGDF
ncbi:MAG: ribonuclease H-like domain-containing protein [Nanoarchaeota archaeon]|nr:ribonuclease H-like domain-containing protein [Nanoarchaeota archaeon]